MKSDPLDAILKKLADNHSNTGISRAIHDQASSDMLRRPALGKQLIERMCATAADAPEMELLMEVLFMALDAARMASESRLRRGDAFLAAVAEAISLAAGEGCLSPGHKLLLARVWTQCGLDAPPGLELSEADEMETPGMENPPTDIAAVESMIDNMFSDLIEASGGDALELHSSFEEILATMPAEIRTFIVSRFTERPESICLKLATFWLLDPAAPIRLAAASALSKRTAAGGVSTKMATKLVMLRSWMPDDDARKVVDHVLKVAMRSGLATTPAVKPWPIRSIVASLPDGGGAQSIVIALQSGGSRKSALVLIKSGHGIKDAFTVHCHSAAEQNALSQRIVAETGSGGVTRTWLERNLSMALADGLAAEIPAAPGLIEVAELCGFSDLRPEPYTPEELIAALPVAKRVGSLSAQERRELIDDSEDWHERHGVVGSWFEESDDVHDIMQNARSMPPRIKALWKWIESRRNHWTMLVARSADVLAASEHPDAESFAATAMALREGKKLKKIPLMENILHETIGAWRLGNR